MKGFSPNKLETSMAKINILINLEVQAERPKVLVGAS